MREADDEDEVIRDVYEMFDWPESANTLLQPICVLWSGDVCTFACTSGVVCGLLHSEASIDLK